MTTTFREFIEKYLYNNNQEIVDNELDLIPRDGINKKKVLKVHNAHERLKDDFNVADTTKIMIDKSDHSSHLWCLGGFEGIPAKISSFLLQSGGMTVRRILRLNLMDGRLLGLCSSLVCSPGVKVVEMATNPGFLTRTARKCTCCLSRYPYGDCPFVFVKKDLHNDWPERKICFQFYFDNRDNSIRSYALAKLPPSTWNVKVGDVNFADYIIKHSIEKRMMLYAANKALKDKRIANPLPGWGLGIDDPGRQQLVNTTFKLFDSPVAAVYTIKELYFGKSKNINTIIVSSTLQNETSLSFPIDVRAFQDGYVFNIRFSRIHPFPRMSLEFDRRWLYQEPIVLNACPTIKIWANARSY